MTIELTGLEIKHLAESAGFIIDNECIESDELESIHTITKCSGKGVLDVETGLVEHYKYVTRCDGCDSGEVFPLGNPITKESS